MTRGLRLLSASVVLLAAGALAAAEVAAPTKLAANLAAGKKQTIITYGTSLTAGGAWVAQLAQALKVRYGEQAPVINSGRGAMWSKWGVDNLDQRVIQKSPDAVIVEFAINDAFLAYKTSVADARANLENMIDRILKARPDCQIILMTMNPPIGVHLERRPRIEEYYQMYRDVAATRKLHLIDHYPAWKAILDNDAARFKKLVPDGIHPNPAGCSEVITPAIWQSVFGGDLPQPKKGGK